VQPRNFAINQGASAAALIDLAQRKDYELIATTPLNLLFTTKALFGLFNITDNSLPAMRDDSEVPHVFVGYDGHIFLRDSGESGVRIWNGMLLPESAVQLLPKRLQKYPERYSDFDKSVYLCWKLFRKSPRSEKPLHCFWSFLRRPRLLRRIAIHTWNLIKIVAGR
jgi:hypothetical protein